MRALGLGLGWVRFWFRFWFRFLWFRFWLRCWFLFRLSSYDPMWLLQWDVHLLQALFGSYSGSDVISGTKFEPEPNLEPESKPEPGSKLGA